MYGQRYVEHPAVSSPDKKSPRYTIAAKHVSLVILLKKRKYCSKAPPPTQSVTSLCTARMNSILAFFVSAPVFYKNNIPTGGIPTSSASQ
jgi:hypothetical protein